MELLVITVIILCLVLCAIFLAKRPIYGLALSIFLVAGINVRLLFSNDIIETPLPVSYYDIIMLPFLLIGLRIILKRPRTITLDWKYVNSVLLLLLAVIGLLYGFSSGYAPRVVLREFRNVLYMVLIILITANVVRSVEDFSILENSLILSGIIIGVWQIAYFILRSAE